MERKDLDSLLEELLPTEFTRVNTFSIDWILNSPEATEDSVRKVYGLLCGYGLTDTKIASQAALLGMNPETIERNYQNLKKYGLTDKKIASRADLLERDPETIERNYQNLKKYGLTDEKIATNAALLGMNPETIERNYQNHISLLRQDYTNRNSGRELLQGQAQLLGIPPETIEANVQFLHHRGIDYNNGLLLGTTAQLKRKKMAWMLRELFDYRQTASEDKEAVIGSLYDFVRDNPNLLVPSISTLEKRMDKLREKAKDYLKPNETHINPLL